MTRRTTNQPKADKSTAAAAKAITTAATQRLAAEARELGLSTEGSYGEIRQRIEDYRAISDTMENHYDAQDSAESTSGFLAGIPGPVLALAYVGGVAAEVVIENVQRLAH
jgi:hypothetical protein